jgi:hypothetical protein
LEVERERGAFGAFWVSDVMEMESGMESDGGCE